MSNSFLLAQKKIKELLIENEITPTQISPDKTLVDDLGLKSMDLAILVANLELDLGVEPFLEDFAITDIRTLGDLCEAFDKTLQKNS
jgi:acyl carrier protein|tara:strand:+ start:1274 stop:1534 length:261 start_codon:yes stop_codon:yes gene_type:complete